MKKEVIFCQIELVGVRGAVEFNLAESKQPQGKLDVFLVVFDA